MNSFQPKMLGITLAICTHNGRQKLEQTLLHVLAQDVPNTINWELLVVDNASTDGTAEFVRSLWPENRTHHLRIIREEKPGALHARLRAIQEARYGYLSYIDDDNWVSSNWVAEVYRIFETYPDVGMISCPSVAHLSESPPNYFERWKGWLAVGSRFEDERLIDTRPITFWTAGLSLRLEALTPLFDTAYMPCLTGRTGKHTYAGEDHELCLTLSLLGWYAYFSRKIQFVHEIPPARLEVSYLERMFQNGGRNALILDIYRNEYRQRLLFHPRLAIIEYLWTFLDRTARYRIKKFIGKANTPLHLNRVSYLTALGRVQSYFIHFARIGQAQQNIRILRQIGRS
ncbi:MAG: glycosyltransferase family 2 protein [Anaerolineales bacterium]|nr:glycosyltransferase family 2 protein [Anaerolineales bacterium]